MIKRKYNYDEYLGKQIGHLTIVEILKSKLSNGRKFLTKCICGKEKIFDASLVIRGRNKSCGCKQQGSPRPSLRGPKIEKCNDLTNLRFGKLVVLKIDPNYKSNYVRWFCRCECGNEKSIRAGHLKEGNVSSCGKCVRSGKNCYRWKGYEEISGKFFYGIKSRAKSRNLIFDITIKQIWDLYLKQNKKCALSGLPLNFPSIVGATNGTASLDRINNKNGYFIENCQWVHKDINFLKQDFNEKELLYYCELITNYKNEKPQETNLEVIDDYII